MDILTLNAIGSGTPEIKQLDGVNHLVVPTIAIGEGLVNNIFYSEAEITKSLNGWNGVPVPVGHPTAEGKNITANSPAVEKDNIGRFYNARVEDKKLKGEIWINIDKAKRNGYGWIVNTLQQKEMMEISTGLVIRDKEQIVVNGMNVPSAKNLLPDHVALIIDGQGAYSIADGGGAMRVNKGEDSQVSFLVSQLKSFTEALVANTKGLFSTAQKEAIAMTKDEMINAIIVNKANQFSEDDKPTLEAMDEKILSKLVVNESDEKGDTPDSKAELKTEPKGEDTVIGNDDKNSEGDEVFTINADEKEIFNQLLANAKVRADALRKQVAEGYPSLTAEMVANMDMTAIEAMAKDIKPEADYSGQSGLVVDLNANNKEAVVGCILSDSFGATDKGA